VNAKYTTYQWEKGMGQMGSSESLVAVLTRSTALCLPMSAGILTIHAPRSSLLWGCYRDVPQRRLPWSGSLLAGVSSGGGQIVT
jgi:hypothetical protein